MFYSWKCIWKYRLRNGGNFVQGRQVNNNLVPSETFIQHPPGLNSGDGRQIRMRFKESNWYFYKTEIRPNNEINEWSFSNPIPDLDAILGL